MTQTHGVLDYASPPKPGGLRSVGKMLAMLAAFSFAGGFLGALVGQFAFEPLYASSGMVFIQQTPSRINAPPAVVPQIQLLPIVTTALSAARQLPAGHSLPSSPVQALGGARIIVISKAGGLTRITYTSVDPAAAACMAREIVNAYSNAIAASQNNPPFVVIELEAPTAATPQRGMFPLRGGMAGMVGGIVIFIVWVVFRAVRRSGAV